MFHSFESERRITDTKDSGKVSVPGSVLQDEAPSIYLAKAFAVPLTDISQSS